MQCSAHRYSTVQYSTVQYSTLQYSTAQYNTVQYSRVEYSAVQYCAGWENGVPNLSIGLKTNLHLTCDMRRVLKQNVALAGVKVVESKYVMFQGPDMFCFRIQIWARDPLGQGPRAPPQLPLSCPLPRLPPKPSQAYFVLGVMPRIM
jgi:hypothetical protein